MKIVSLAGRKTLRCASQLITLIALNALTCFGATTLYHDDFESYQAQNPAPNPLTNGPAGGEWFFVDPNPPTIATNEHQILNASSLGAGFYSRVWSSLTNNGQLTNAISLTALPAASSHTFRLSFVTAADTFTASRNITFNYEISSSAGSLTLLSAGNLDSSQTFGSLSGTGIATAGTRGKTADRRFEFVFQGTGLTSADKIFFKFTRVTNNAPVTPSLTIFLDDVRLAIDDSNPPLVQSVQPVLSMQHVRVGFSEPVQADSATNPANYSFLGDSLSIQAVTMISPTVAEIYTTDQSPNSSHTLQINGVLGQTGTSLVSTQLNFTASSLAISPVRYDAGTTTTRPAGPLDPTTFEAGNWVKAASTQFGMTEGAVIDDAGTGLNAWRITDNNSAANGGVVNFTIPIEQPSIDLARTNGWRIVTRSRLVDNFGSTGADHVVIFADAATRTRYGLIWGVDASLNLYVTPLGGSTYTLTTSGVEATTAYHTHILAYNPETKAVSYYFDGRLIVDNYTGQVITVPKGLTFGSASSGAKGEMNYNLVQLDVVGTTAPVVLRNPASSVNGVGQKVTFSAEFSPFVNSYQWLSNGVVIPGATATNYTTGFITLENDGDEYKLRALSGLGNVETAPAVLTVTEDTSPPVIVAAKASLLRDRITLTFSEPIQESLATDIANYSWLNPGVTNVTARLLDPLTVELRAGPFETSSNYTVRVSNLRDTSNLPIAPNSPATVVFPQLSALASYNAGTTTSAPAGPPDPTSVEGGSWLAQVSNHPDISVSPIVDDLGTGLNAWQVRDATTAVGMFASYTQQLSTNAQDLARHYGWVLNVHSRLSESFGEANTQFALFEDYRLDRFGIALGATPDGNLLVGTSTAVGFTGNVVTTAGVGLNDYHLHQVAYDPVTASASYYFDGTLVAWKFPVSRPLNSLAELMWGARGSAPRGVMNYNSLEFLVVDAPYVEVDVNNGNAEITYRGILDVANQLSNPSVWSPVQTNLTGGTYSVPLNSQTQQFFRARMP